MCVLQKQSNWNLRIRRAHLRETCSTASVCGFRVARFDATWRPLVDRGGDSAGGGGVARDGGVHHADRGPGRALDDARNVTDAPRGLGAPRDDAAAAAPPAAGTCFTHLRESSPAAIFSLVSRGACSALPQTPCSLGGVLCR